MLSQDAGRNPRQVFGAMVRFYRERAGLSRAELARQVCKSAALVEAIELGRRVATPQVTGDLDAALGAEGALGQLRDEIGDGLGYQPHPLWSRQPHPLWFQEWTLKEAEAAALRWFEPMLVPGLLQTADYARAIFRTRLKTTEEEIDEQVAARLKRQDVLSRSELPLVWVLIDEGVLRRPVGGRHVMCEQLRRLGEAARQPNVVIEVIPAGVGAHDGLEGAFAIADFPDAPSVGYRECAGGGHVVEESQFVTLLDLMWDTLRADALPRAASLALLEEAAKSWASVT